MNDDTGVTPLLGVFGNWAEFAGHGTGSMPARQGRQKGGQKAKGRGDPERRAPLDHAGRITFRVRGR